jgi:hypothetical protein
MSNFVKKPCKSCPFRLDVKPFLHPNRVEEIAYSAQNPYSDFTCHSTIEYDGDEDDLGRPTGDFSGSKTCAGFLTMRAQDGQDEDFLPEGFVPSWDLCYTDPYEMVDAYTEEWEKDK